jgi:hypothetical protein
MTDTNFDLTDYEDLVSETTVRIRFVPADPKTMPEQFARSTMLALAAQQEILSLPLDENDPHYRVKLSAKATVASAQITAQLKSDETRLKSTTAVISYYDEIKEAIEAYRKKMREGASNDLYQE